MMVNKNLNPMMVENQSYDGETNPTMVNPNPMMVTAYRDGILAWTSPMNSLPGVKHCTGTLHRRCSCAAEFLRREARGE